MSEESSANADYSSLVSDMRKKLVRPAGYRRRHPSILVGSAIVIFAAFVAVAAPYLSPYDPNVMHPKDVLTSPSSQYLLGTDQFGRDIASRLMFGTRVSLFIAATAISISLLGGIGVGLISGYYRGLIDLCSMRILEIIFVFPPILLGLVVMAMLGTHLSVLIVTLGIVYLPQFARLVRGSVLSLMGENFIEGGRAIGASDMRIIFRHILPNVLGPVIVLLTLRLSTAILIESGLSFLGFGVQPPTPSWGNMLSSGKIYIEIASWAAIFPGIAIFLIVLGFNLLGDGLRDILDPRLGF